MKTLAELEEAKKQAVEAHRTAEAVLIGTARAVVQEKRVPFFTAEQATHLGRPMFDALLERLGTAVDVERAAQDAAQAAGAAIVAYYDAKPAKVG